MSDVVFNILQECDKAVAFSDRYYCDWIPIGIRARTMELEGSSSVVWRAVNKRSPSTNKHSRRRRLSCVRHKVNARVVPFFLFLSPRLPCPRPDLFLSPFAQIADLCNNPQSACYPVTRRGINALHTRRSNNENSSLSPSLASRIMNTHDGAQRGPT